MPPASSIALSPPAPRTPFDTARVVFLACALFLIGYPLAGFALPALLAPPYDNIANALRMALEGGALLYASGRPDLPRGFLGFLRSCGWISVLSAGTIVLGLIPASLGGPWISEPVMVVWFFISYLGGFGAFLLHPRLPLRGSRAWVFALDSLVVVGGLTALSWILITWPLSQSAHPAPVLRYAVAQIITLFMINLIALQGLAVPNGRAFWNLVAGQAMYIPVVLLAQYLEAGAPWSLSVVYLWYFGAVVFTMRGAIEVRRASVVGEPQRVAPEWLHQFNPVAFATPLLVCIALVVAIVRGHREQVPALAVLLLAITAVISARIVLSQRELWRLNREAQERERRAQAERMAAVAGLAGGIAHEFNNLMTVVIGRADLALMETTDPSAMRGDLAGIRQAGERAAHLTHQLLLYSGGAPDLRRSVDVLEVIRELEPRLRALAGARLTLELPATLPALHAERTQLQLALLELVQNASNATRSDGQVRVRVLAEAEPLEHAQELLPAPAAPHVVLRVEDDGVGIAPAELRRIFEPFYTGRPRAESTGLGLAAVHGVVAAHGGGLEIRSTPGEGTVVQLRLPRAAAP